ncbi:hypothetical protein [Paenibacillus paeoniae]|uniref:Uncharacterized protein n=1 Tax=Paenibacillus paeoniae TaxID=2292705 RepID=A0A371P0D6_9BACL|nr:hypothetical protein [Paenibacillus paeoniae]REK69393.1 hypothetical protein DX130_24870 [Paenibacillus paeoniae]
MAGEGLQDRINRLKLEGKVADREEQAEGQSGSGQAADPGPVHANEHWRALYARVRAVTEGLRR